MVFTDLVRMTSSTSWIRLHVYYCKAKFICEQNPGADLGGGQLALRQSSTSQQTWTESLATMQTGRDDSICQVI